MTDTIVCDIDNTISYVKNGNYEKSTPNKEIIEKLKCYKENGYEIVLFTARNMRRFNGDIEMINQHTLPILKEWLKRHDVEHDKLILGKPWCGENGFYVDDRAVRPKEFLQYSSAELLEILKKCS